MGRASGRQRGNIEELPSGGFRVRVYAGIDALTKRPHYLRETVPAGPGAEREAERVRTRLLAQLDQRKNPRTRATLNHLLERWLEVLDVDISTKRGYVSKINKHVRPNLGDVQVAKLDVETLDAFYARLRRCREHCHGRRFIQHRTSREHVCDEHRGTACSPPRPTECRSCKRACRPHACSGLADSTVRQIHWILTGALSRGVRWGWIGINPADNTEPPPLPHPDPNPPSSEEAARLVEEAWSNDPEWGALIWTAMTTGARRGELCALHLRDFDEATGVLTVRRAIFIDDNGELREKDTKTHQQRRIVLDVESQAVVSEHIERLTTRAEQLDLKLDPDAYLFSSYPDCSTPLNPDSVTQRYDRMAKRLRIDTTLRRLRQYAATELILAGVDLRAVAGRLGHGGGGATTLRVYAAWTSEADQRAAAALSARMPPRPRPDARADTTQHPVSNSSPAD